MALSLPLRWPVLATDPDLPDLPDLVIGTVAATYTDACAQVEEASADPDNPWYGWSMIVGPWPVST